jgi:c-di-GMP-binding flagellar brake protein YcgR
MNEEMLVCKAEPRNILSKFVEEKVPAIMSYQSADKWHVARILPSSLGANTFKVELCQQQQRHPVNIKMGQAVGIAVKYGYGKFLFDCKVVDLEPSSDSSRGGKIILSVPSQIDMAQRRSYFRVEVPESMEVSIDIWQCRHPGESLISKITSAPDWRGKLVDLSAGGVQLAIDNSQKPRLKTGQFMKLQFTPMPGKEPIEFGGQVRTVFPTADEKHLCVGLQVVGLEVSKSGRAILARLIDISENYHQINESGDRGKMQISGQFEQTK